MSKPFKDLTGQKFGRLTALYRLHNYHKNGNYEPSNCRWVDRKTQVRNRRNTKYITYNGETKPLAEWCELLNLSYRTVQSRLRTGWTIEKALEIDGGVNRV